MVRKLWEHLELLDTAFVLKNNELDPSLIEFDLPDPQKDDISSLEFFDRLDQAWNVCDKFDLQTEIWRGRILIAVRDRERKGGECRGAGFLQWLRDREISKTRAYGLIKIAESADHLLREGLLDESSVNKFSKSAFLETANSAPEVQLLVSEAANEGKEITRKQVRMLTDDFTSATSALLPDEIKQLNQENLIPSKFVAPLVRELQKLPKSHQEDFRITLKEEPQIECIKDVTNTARWISKANDACVSVRAFHQEELDLERAMKEAKRLDALGLLSDALGQAQALESSVLKLHSAWRRLGGLQERLWLESGSSTPYLRDLLTALQTLTGATMRVSLGELAGGKRVRLQLVEEAPDQLEPPKIN